MIFISFLFAILLLFVLAYYTAFEYRRYKTATVMAEELGGSAVFKIGGSYMRCHHKDVEERFGSCRIIKWRGAAY